MASYIALDDNNRSFAVWFHVHCEIAEFISNSLIHYLLVQHLRSHCEQFLAFRLLLRARCLSVRLEQKWNAAKMCKIGLWVCIEVE